MQIIFLPQWLAILTCFIVWPILQIIIALLLNHQSDARISSFSKYLKTQPWEDNGKIYKRIFKINRWQGHLSDGAAITKNGFRKKALQKPSLPNINKFIVETYRAELIHIFCILPFWIFGFWSPPIVILVMLLYALIANLPCILLQRYNRPRLIRVRDQLLKNSSSSASESDF